MFDVAVTFETSAVDSETNKRTDGTYLSFYDEEPSTNMPYSSTLYGTHDLIEGDVVDGDCTKTDKPCSVLIPEGEVSFCIFLLAFTFSFSLEALIHVVIRLIVVWDVHTKAEIREGQSEYFHVLL